MGRLLRKIEIEREKQQWVNLLETLESAKAIMKDENISEEERTKKCTKMLEEKEKELTFLIETFDNKSTDTCWDFSTERKSDVFAEDEIIYIRGYRPEENNFIRQIKKENSSNPELYDDDELWELSSEWIRKDRIFLCSIFEKKSREFVGYISLKDTRSNLWEIAIELLAEHCNKGYGTRAIQIFLPAISAISGKAQFQALVETDNIPSQRLMEKCGAELIDIYDYSFDGDEDAAIDFEERHLHLITDRMVKLAQVIDVKPRKLLSHVLDYRFFVENGVIVDKCNVK